jgi:hypothetical protein
VAVPGVFISYRREDSSGYAGRLFDILAGHFGRDRIYMDIDTIKGGDDFAAVIDEKVGQCDVLLAVIGEKWLTAAGEHGDRRLDMPGDFVRQEIAKALERSVRVIPVLVGGASIPQPDDLPPDLRPLSVHQAMDLRDAHFHADADLLIDLLHKTVPGIGRPRDVRWRRFVLAALAVVAVAGMAGGLILSRQAKPPVRSSPASAPAQPVAPLVNVAGKWKATIRYDWGDTYAETFDFEVAGSELSGTASLLGRDRGIFDGKIDGGRISFMTKSLTSLGDKTYEDKHFYKGTVEGDTITFSLLTDSGAESHVPVRFTATR